MKTFRHILIADDHSIYREGLRQVLSREMQTKNIDEAASGPEVMKKIQERNYDLLILDISMPGRNGLDILADAKSSRPKLPVLILSMYPEEQYALRAFRLGAAGYVTKGNPSQELLDALHKISLGKRYISPAIADCLIDTLDGTNTPPHQSLSNREMQVLNLLATGKTVGIIANELSLSVKTVSTHRSNILRKMNLRNNAELTRYAIENGLA